MNFHLRPYNQYILNIVTNIYLGLDFIDKICLTSSTDKTFPKETTSPFNTNAGVDITP